MPQSRSTRFRKSSRLIKMKAEKIRTMKVSARGEMNGPRIWRKYVRLFARRLYNLHGHRAGSLRPGAVPAGEQQRARTRKAPCRFPVRFFGGALERSKSEGPRIDSIFGVYVIAVVRKLAGDNERSCSPITHPDAARPATTMTRGSEGRENAARSRAAEESAVAGINRRARVERKRQRNENFAAKIQGGNRSDQ